MSNESKALAAKAQKLSGKKIGNALLNNALIIIMLLVAVYVAITQPSFLSASSLINLLSLTAAYLPVALGIAGCIVLTGTDLSAGRAVGITACIAASLLQKSDIANKMWPSIGALPIPVVIIIVVAIGNFVVGNPPLLNFAGGSIQIPNYVIYAILLTGLMWFIWNKTTFGKNMFALGANEEAARVSGVNVFLTTIAVFALAGAMYGWAGFVESARIASNTANTGVNYELDAIAACVIGGVSFVGGIGKISGIVIGVIMLRLIFVALPLVGMDQNLQYAIKGGIILFACALDMRKYLVKK